MRFGNESDEFLIETWEACIEFISENQAQFDSEVALFGDAGPGAALPIEAARRDLEALEEALRFRGLIGAPPEPMKFQAIDFAEEDIPF